MLFRDTQGKLVNIERSNFHNDKDYYEKICDVLNIRFPKEQNQLQAIMKLVNKKTKHS